MIRLLIVRFDCFVVVFGFTMFAPTAFALPNADWFVQFGAGGGDFGAATAVDSSGNAYVAGATQGNLQGPSSGGADSYARKYDSSGVHVWTQQMGTAASFEGSGGIAVDSRGDVYHSGNIGSGSAGGDTDAFLEKRTTDGKLIWQQRLGSSGNESSVGLAIGGPEQNAIYISGTTEGNLAAPLRGLQDRFLTKYDETGKLLWSQQFGTQVLDYGSGVAADTFGNAIVGGSTDGSFVGNNRGRRDLFVQKYAGDGTLLWTHQDGTAFDDVVTDVSVDRIGNIYVTGYTQNGSLVGGTARSYDAFLRKLDAFGTVVWTRQLVSAGLDYGLAISIGADGIVFMGGQTSGDLGGQNAGGFDAYFATFDTNGGLLSLEQFGSSRDDAIKDIAVNDAGYVVFAGDTLGSLNGTNAGFLDPFIFRKTIVPEPRSGPMFAGVLFSLLAFERWRVFSAGAPVCGDAGHCFGAPLAFGDVVARARA